MDPFSFIPMLGGVSPLAFGSLAPTAPAAPSTAVGAPLDIRSPIQQQQDAAAASPAFDPTKFNAAIGALQKQFGPGQQSPQVQWMKPMNLKPQGFGMLNGF